ncbi:MAG: M15 family metallopeptidase [Treponema sp.]|nr:M15 family metallopeptidase [Treponema sp.]
MARIRLSVILIIFSAVNIFALGGKQKSAEPELHTTAPEPPPVSQPTRAERIVKSLIQAYPDRIEKAEFRNNDWALLMNDKWYCFAGGRLLPENMLENTENYRPNQFYNYPEELPPWKELTPEEIKRYNSWTENRSQNPPRRSSFFLDELWQAPNRAETEKKLVRISFLGKSTRVHQAIQKKLAAVESIILQLGKVDPQVQTWINGMGSIEGYGWRNIAETQSRSFHSYGLAVDLLPRNMGNKQTYWLWTSQYRDDWYNVSYNERYHPPASVIKTFEVHGFVWGGKWPMFDTMHFEYRPEVMLLNGLTLLTN